jgi:hypothetical protein
MKRTKIGRTLAIAIVAAACACLPGTCLASETAKLNVKLTPERLGAGTTIVFAFKIAARGGGVPSPLTEMDLRYPAGLRVATSELGIENCTPTTLETRGPNGCPPDSKMGYGSAVVEVPFGAELIRETASITTFMAPVQNEQISVLFYAAGKTPILAQLVFPAVLAQAPTPSGGSLNTELPLIPTLPRAPDAAVVQLNATIGPTHLTYYERVHGETVAYTPKGIALPRHCPRGGFPFIADFSFQDATKASATAHVACPRRS